ncbi:hypothetical protein ACSSVY_004285 [Roseovarius sp. MBR-51]
MLDVSTSPALAIWQDHLSPGDLVIFQFRVSGSAQHAVPRPRLVIDIKIVQLFVRTPSVLEAVRLAMDLARRAAHLNALAPKLRAKGAGEAVEMFLTRDAVVPSAQPLPDRAARRLCDRLVDLGAVRELTGRDTFRLYGV